jgi:hypothetical protein
MLFVLGILVGAGLAVTLWQMFSRLTGWQIAGLLLAIWMTMVMFSLISLRRQNRR